jgi:hypothetical protein
MPHQEAVTVRAWIRAGAEDALDALLREVGSDVEGNATIPFATFGNIHFARLVIVPEARDLENRVIRASLVYAANVDGDGAAHLRDLVRQAGEGVDRIFSHCEDYPRAANEHTRFSYLSTRRIPTHAFYVNTVGRTAKQAGEEAVLRDALESELDRLQRSGDTASAARVRTQLQHHVEQNPQLAFARKPAEPLSLSYRIRERLTFFGTLFGLLLLAPAFLIGLPFFLLTLRMHEVRDAQRRQPLRLSAEEQFKLRLQEDHVVQNQISAVGNVKRGAFRFLTMRALLWGLDFAAKHVFNKGDLGTVRLLELYGVDTIHFAQWIVIDDGRRVLFFSNYDGSLVSYMDDFVNKVAWGLNAVFSNGETYPNTRWLVLDGAHDEQQFKAFLHKHQIRTQAWYSAHKRYTALNLMNNAGIRRELYAERDAAPLLARL